MEKVSVIIPAYNEEVLLFNTLNHLIDNFDNLDFKKFEIVVVDNASTDRTQEIALKAGARVVVETKRSIAKARNTGAKFASGQNFIFVDADTLVPMKVIQEVLDLMKDPKFGGGGATIEFDCNHGRFFSGILIPQLWNLISRTFKLGAGSFLFCRRDDFFQVGGFPEYLYAGEEIKFSLSLKKLLGKTKRKFIILQEIPVITSSRKLAWYGDLKIICTLFLFFIFPFSIRFKSLCNFWYQRPK